VTDTPERLRAVKAAAKALWDTDLVLSRKSPWGTNEGVMREGIRRAGVMIAAYEQATAEQGEGRHEIYQGPDLTGYGYRATCTCGWTGTGASLDSVETAGDAHRAEVSPELQSAELPPAERAAFDAFCEKKWGKDWQTYALVDSTRLAEGWLACNDYHGRGVGEVSPVIPPYVGYSDDLLEAMGHVAYEPSEVERSVSERSPATRSREAGLPRAGKQAGADAPLSPDEVSPEARRSACCSATFHTAGSEEGTNCYVCDACGKGCDPAEVSPEGRGLDRGAIIIASQALAPDEFSWRAKRAALEDDASECVRAYLENVPAEASPPALSDEGLRFSDEEGNVISELWGWGPLRTNERGLAIREAWAAARDFFGAKTEALATPNPPSLPAQDRQTIIDALDTATEFIGRVEKWSGSDPDEIHEVLAALNAASEGAG